jgi:hypothetical protein
MEMKELMERENISRAELARRMKFSRARITQMMNLLKFSPEVIDKRRSFFYNKSPRCSSSLFFFQSIIFNSFDGLPLGGFLRNCFINTNYTTNHFLISPA